MLSHREGKPVVVCDGCYGVIGEAWFPNLPAGVTTGRGYVLSGDKPLATVQKHQGDTLAIGEVCSDACAEKWMKMPISKRAEPEAPVPSEP